MSVGNPDFVPTHLQYRVCWRRKNRVWMSKNFERRSAAERLAARLRYDTEESLHYRCDHEVGVFDCVQPLEEGPRIDQRKVGNWGPLG